MPGIPFFDNNTSYTFAKILDVFISAGFPVFTLFSAGILFADWRDWRPIIWWAKAVKFIIHIFVFGTALFCILYSIDGRYTETELGDYGTTNYYYFGKAKNGVRYGFGKLFDEQKIIYMISDAKGNKSYANVKQYTTVEDIYYLSFTGTINNGKREGYGEAFTYIGGKVKPSYKGNYHNGYKCGEGTEYIYYTPSGMMAWKYEGEQLDDMYNGYGKRWDFDTSGALTNYYAGGWAEDKYYGYGMDLRFEDGKVTHAYRGTFWDNQYWGKGILEYLTESGALTIWVGKFNENNQTDVGAFYNENGEFWTSTINGTLIYNDDGTTSTDDSKVAELQEEWPFPDTIMYSKSADEFPWE